MTSALLAQAREDIHKGGYDTIVRESSYDVYERAGIDFSNFSILCVVRSSVLRVYLYRNALYYRRNVFQLVIIL